MTELRERYLALLLELNFPQTEAKLREEIESTSEDHIRQSLLLMAQGKIEEELRNGS